MNRNTPASDRHADVAANEHRCEATTLDGRIRCEREAGHPGWHTHGVETTANGVTAWGKADDVTEWTFR